MAASYNTRSIGVILSGLLDDGTLGMQAIKRSGGTCIVQDPGEAEFPDMPLSVINNMEINFCLKLSEIGNMLASITQIPQDEIEAPPDIIAEAKIAEQEAVGVDHVKNLGQQTFFSCPDCGGVLWQITKDNISEYRCHVGHSFSERHLIIKKGETLETTLWVSVRILEERKNIFLKMKELNARKGLDHLVKENQSQIDLIDVHINQLKEILLATETE
jgi:two-component system chemotaxis response regulator CheB